MVIRTLHSLKFLVVAPLIFAMLVVINVMTWSGQWWVQWAGLGLGIAWVISLMRVVRGVIVAGGLAALGTYLFRQR